MTGQQVYKLLTSHFSFIVTLKRVLMHVGLISGNGPPIVTELIGNGGITNATAGTLCKEICQGSPISDSSKKRVQKWMNNIEHVEHIEVDRYYFSHISEVKSVMLH